MVYCVVAALLCGGCAAFEADMAAGALCSRTQPPVPCSGHVGNRGSADVGGCLHVGEYCGLRLALEGVA
jgi:hypothetical protein